MSMTSAPGAVHPAIERQRRELARDPRRHAEDRRVDLDAGRNAQYRDPLADRRVDVARRPIAAGEQQQVDTRVGHRHAAAACRRRRGSRSARPTTIGTKPAATATSSPMLGERDASRRPRPGRDSRAERGGGPRPGPPHRTQRLRASQDLRSVGALEPDPAAHAGNRVHDNPEALHRASSPDGHNAARELMPATAVLADVGPPGRRPLVGVVERPARRCAGGRRSDAARPGRTRDRGRPRRRSGVRTAAYSSSSSRANVSHGSSVIGSGTIHG